MGHKNNINPSEHRDLDNDPRVLLLINLYQLQLVRGCGSPDCITLACYTYRKRHSSKPLRRLSAVSARATAFYLIDSENPESNLCPFVVRYTLGPLAESRNHAHVFLDDLVRFTNHLTSLSTSDRDPPTTTRQDPCSFAQRLFNASSVKHSLDGPVGEEAHNISSKSPFPSIQTDHIALTEAGDRLETSLSQFNQTNDIYPIVDAFIDAIKKLVTSYELVRRLSRDSNFASHAYAFPEFLNICDNPDPVALRLATLITIRLARLKQAIPTTSSGSHLPFVHYLKHEIPESPEEHLLCCILRGTQLMFTKLGSQSSLGFRWWIQLLFLNSWDKSSTVDLNSLPAAALMFADFLLSMTLDIDIEMKAPRVKIHDPYNAALQWWKIIRSDHSGSISLLNYPWALTKLTQVRCFRAICLHRMSDAVGESFLNMRVLHSSSSGLFHGLQRSDEPQRAPPEIVSLQFGQLQLATSRHLTLQVDRDNIIGDTFSGLWRRQTRELFRPLKVKMTNAGELGVDQGGLAQELIRLVFMEVFDPTFAIFSVDDRTRMAWIDPKSLEALYKLELLGTLMALAIFNGFILPVNFPLALYRQLCNLPVKTISHIEDGWPDLAAGLRQLLAWEDGDVSETFCRTYVFTFEAFGKMIHVDMTKPDESWSPIAAIANQRNTEDNAPLVTNANRKKFVADYIRWLTYRSIAPQYNAFARGFHRILDPKILRTIEPDVLRDVAEGERNIDTKELQRVARYDAGYCSHRAYIKEFWDVVHSFDERKKKQLLEFVTASDRIPITGMDTVDFVIQRHGGDSESLPTSVTCFGRLLLPQYENKKKLSEKLELALENSTGFGLS